MKITPISQDNKGRFNRRNITLTGEKCSVYNESVFIGLTDTGKRVAVCVFDLEYYKGKKVWGESTLIIGVQYQTGGFQTRKANWPNQYTISTEELEAIKNIK